MGARLTFADHARAGVPIALMSLGFASFWLADGTAADAAAGSGRGRQRLLAMPLIRAVTSVGACRGGGSD